MEQIEDVVRPKVPFSLQCFKASLNSFFVKSVTELVHAEENEQLNKQLKLLFHTFALHLMKKTTVYLCL